MEQSLAVYRVFFEIAAAGNISRAAKKLNISQPAISKSLAKLEKELDTRLFTRTSRGVRDSKSPHLTVCLPAAKVYLFFV